MALPKQVRDQVAELEEIERQLAAPEQPVEETAVEESKSEKQQTNSKAEEVKSAEPTSDGEASDDFKQKYNTLRGKYDAEVPRLHQQLRELSEQMKVLTDAQEAAKKEEEEKPKEPVSLITDAEREEYGEELIDVQRRIAQEVAQTYEQKLDAQNKVIEALQSQIANTGNEVGQMSFSQKLHQLVPDFQEIDQDQRWMKWLNEHDPMLRGPRRDQAQAAFDKGDAEAVAHYVKLWRSTLEPEVENTAAREVELEKQVSPSRSVATQTTTNSTGKRYSEKEINNAWTKIRHLNTAGKYDEATKLEADITKAYLEGRVSGA